MRSVNLEFCKKKHFY